ncbi:inorganic phosphate transporter [Magnetospira thiophila]
MELESLARLESVSLARRQERLRLGMALLFLAAVVIFAGTAFPEVPQSYLLVVAAMIGAYMALNIGANDVANNVGPAVGSKTLTLTGAIIIAAIFEAAGALIAGGDVVGTIKKDIINPQAIADTQTFVWLMMAALLAGALWLNLATANGMPVSTTHSIVGGVLGAGIAAGGWEVANWGKMGSIALSWVISPVCGGLIAAMFLYIIKRQITYQRDLIAAARSVVPLLIAVMTWAFTTYLVLKGIKHLIKIDFPTAMGIGIAAGVAAYFIVKPIIYKASAGLPATKEGVNKLFVIPLICAAALLSFAHGANDVANAVGPLAGVYDALLTGKISTKASIPIWVMVVGASGIAVGLALYGPKLIRTVGSEITELDQARAFCIALAAAITVIIASQLGMPISSTHVAIGAVFGVGFLREAIKANYARVIQEIRDHHLEEEDQELEAFLDRFKGATHDEKGEMLRQLKKKRADIAMTKRERKDLNKVYRQELVKRSALIRIASAWIITVPLSGIMAAIIFYTLRGMMLP